MIGEFIPDTATVMATYATVATYRQSPDLARQSAFKAWLAEHERQVAERAWNAGAQAQAAAYGMDKDTGPNPYDLGGENAR